MEDVFKNKGVEPPSIRDNTELNIELGLDSLDYAELVVRLESAFGFDPFALGAIGELKTVADLATLYRQPVS